jgi:uncharacterized OB-fold protein
MLERIDKTTETRHWLGDMEADHYYYSAGIAGERFFNKLRDEGKILGAHCAACQITYVPPRIYCERCFAELGENTLKDMGRQGTVHAYTVAHLDKSGNRLDPLRVFAIIKLGSHATGFLHRLGEIEPEQVVIGMSVEAVLKPRKERRGQITDILYFKPVKTKN